VFAHGKRKTGANIEWANMAHAAHVADWRRRWSRSNEFPRRRVASVVIQSLRNIQTARKELLPLTTNLFTAAALASRSSCASSS